jgi:hypothetical protein
LALAAAASTLRWIGANSPVLFVSEGALLAGVQTMSSIGFLTVQELSKMSASSPRDFSDLIDSWTSDMHLLDAHIELMEEDPLRQHLIHTRMDLSRVRYKLAKLMDCYSQSLQNIPSFNHPESRQDVDQGLLEELVKKYHEDFEINEALLFKDT